VEVAFDEYGLLQIEHWDADAPATAALVAVGTEEAPILFTSAGSTAAGAWQGLVFGGRPHASNRIEHARVSFAGGSIPYIQAHNCSNKGVYSDDQAAIMILGVPAGAFVSSTHIEHSAGFGIDRGWKGKAFDFLDTNTFEDIAWCLQSEPLPLSGGCPAAPECVMD